MSNSCQLLRSIARRGRSQEMPTLAVCGRAGRDLHWVSRICCPCKGILDWKMAPALKKWGKHKSEVISFALQLFKNECITAPMCDWCTLLFNFVCLNCWMGTVDWLSFLIHGWLDIHVSYYTNCRKYHTMSQYPRPTFQKLQACNQVKVCWPKSRWKVAQTIQVAERKKLAFSMISRICPPTNCLVACSELWSFWKKVLILQQLCGGMWPVFHANKGILTLR